MTAKAYQAIFVVVLFNLNIVGVVSKVDESNEEAQPNYEYIQIFKSIPALFEYLLNALEERPEILEKNDVTMFKRNIDMETDESDNSENDNKIDKRDASTSKDLSETTVAYEYGNSNVVMKGLDEIGSNKVISKRFANPNNFNNFAIKEVQKRGNRISRNKLGVLSKLDDDTNDMLWNYGEVFLGFEHLFGLDLKPEEIEERILTAEKLLEEHNNKKEKK